MAHDRITSPAIANHCFRSITMFTSTCKDAPSSLELKTWAVKDWAERIPVGFFSKITYPAFPSKWAFLSKYSGFRKCIYCNERSNTEMYGTRMALFEHIFQVEIISCCYVKKLKENKIGNRGLSLERSDRGRNWRQWILKKSLHFVQYLSEITYCYRTNDIWMN